MIIGLTGPQRSGKTTVANHLVQNHKWHFMSIAALIKEEAHSFAGRSFADHEKDVPQDCLSGKTPRELYIHFGNLDEYQHGFWVNRMMRTQYQGPDEWHVIESVGKQFQMTELVRYLSRGQDGIVLVDVKRPGHDYRDSRSAIRDSLPIIQIVNDADETSLLAKVDDLAAGADNLRHVRTPHHLDMAVAIEKHLEQA